MIMRRLLFLCIALCMSGITAPTTQELAKGKEGNKNMSPKTGTFTLISLAFGHNTPIPSYHTCDGKNISPAFRWKNAPEGTGSFALIVDDPDAPQKTWVHWLLFNIPATETKL